MLQRNPTQQPLFVEQPMRSRMLDSYLADVTQLLSQQRWEAAERAALALPHLGVALSNPDLQSSCASYVQWCEEWIRPRMGVATYESWCAQTDAGNDGLVSGVPVASLRTLRLQRKVRSVIGCTALPVTTDPRASVIAVNCHAIIGAAVRWYQQTGRQSASVQFNMRRLGILH